MAAQQVPKRIRIELTGTVQGVGFRPFVFRLAVARELTGFVFNDDRGVVIEIQGEAACVDGFPAALSAELPPAASITSLAVCELPLLGGAEPAATRFEILPSPGATDGKFAMIPPDLATCVDCRREILDPADRRYRYPFTNCTNCGPRFTIIRDVPYDRVKTTMASFRMCPDCQSEYDDPLNRRFHAQPNACPVCGPRLWLADSQGRELPIQDGDSGVLEQAVALLKTGRILAIKGIGGFHLACNALNEPVVRRLRERKLREVKPFALMVGGLEEARKWVECSEQDARLLASPAAPIMLLKRKPQGATEARYGEIAPSVTPHDHSRLGVMLAYSPLHLLLLQEFGGPLVMTSGNRSDEAICIDNDAAVKTLGGIADAFLLHDREIHLRCDDSVLDSAAANSSANDDHAITIFRRSRGYAPGAVRASRPFAADLLAVGAELKNTFCLTREGRSEALLSHHIGDLENLSTLEAFENGIAHFERLFAVRPSCVVHDLHPDYLSTKWALSRTSRAIGVQHHHAHIAACLDEHAVAGPVFGVALDGTGFGTDGTIWGGEILLADRRDFVRIGHLRPVRLPPGTGPLKNPARLAYSYLQECGLSSRADQTGMSDTERSLLSQVLEKGDRTYTSTSCGRLFDAVSALLGVCRTVDYDGQAAIELERVCADGRLGASEEALCGIGPELREIDWRPLFERLARGRERGEGVPELSRLFHASLARGFADFIDSASRVYGKFDIVLSGGCFFNRPFRGALRELLVSRGFRVLEHRQLSPGDGSISYGQAVVANSVLKEEKSCVSRFR